MLLGNMHRIMWFDKEVRGKKYPNSTILAERFEISVRQAQRDIDYLKNSLGAPLRYIPEKRGYDYEDDAFTLPYVYLTQEQVKVLNYLAYTYENYSNNPTITRVAELFKKFVNGGEQEKEVPVFDITKPEVNNIYVIGSSIKNRNRAMLIYRDPDRGKIELTVHPYKIFNKYEVDYLAAYCEEYDNIAVFRIGRILEAKSLETHFTVREDFDEKNYCSVFNQKPFNAKIKLGREINAEDFRGLHIKDLGNYEYDIEFYDACKLVNILMSIDYMDAIYSPEWLKEKLKERCSEIIKKLNI